MSTKVLIVDDEEANLELLEALITQEKYLVSKATDGEMAFQMVQKERPDIVVMDVVMPKMNGIESCRKIKTHPLTYSVPVIIVTALNTQEEKVKAIKAGADDFINKPFDRVELSARLKSLLRLKAIHARLEANVATLKEMHNAREELMARAARDIEPPLNVLADCLRAVSAEQHTLTPETAQKIEPALFCIEMVTTMSADFVNIMRMEQDRLKQAHEALLQSEQQAAAQQQAEAAQAEQPQQEQQQG